MQAIQAIAAAINQAHGLSEDHSIALTREFHNSPMFKGGPRSSSYGE